MIKRSHTEQEKRLKVLTVIPARGGSKGIPRKNLVDIKGTPLLGYSIIPAVRAVQMGWITKVIVSTDDQEIVEIARCYGAEVPFIRPEDISGDNAKSIDLILHALDYYEAQGEQYDAVLLLQPTSPMRQYEDIEGAVGLFLESGADSLISVYQEDYINEFVTYRATGEYGIPINSNHNKGIRRQEHEPIYVRNGAIYLTKVDYLRRTNQIISDMPLLYKMAKSRSVNIDTLEDLEIVRCLI